MIRKLKRSIQRTQAAKSEAQRYQEYSRKEFKAGRAPLSFYRWKEATRKAAGQLKAPK